MIYHTGDMRDHGIWETTVEGNRRIMDRLFNLYREVFGNIPVYHVLGNHEGDKSENIFLQICANFSYLHSTTSESVSRIYLIRFVVR